MRISREKLQGTDFITTGIMLCVADFSGELGIPLKTRWGLTKCYYTHTVIV